MGLGCFNMEPVDFDFGHISPYFRSDNLFLGPVAFDLAHVGFNLCRTVEDFFLCVCEM